MKRKGKIVSGDEKKMNTDLGKQNQKLENNKPKVETSKENKIKVFTIKRKNETTLIKRTYLVDSSIVIPCSGKGSQGPKKFWVPKSA